MARQRSGKGERGTAKAQRPKRKAAKATTKSTLKATTKSVAKTSKTANTTKTAKTTRTDRPKRAAAKPARVIQKSMPAADVTAGLEPTFQEVQKRAYQIYLSRDGAPGDSASDWLQAERELREFHTARAASRKRQSRSH